MLDIVGSDKDEQDAIKAKAIAELNRGAALVSETTKARGSAIEIMGFVIKMLAQMTAETKNTKKEQQVEYIEAENNIKRMVRDDPKLFESKCGENFKKCLDFVQREIYLRRGSLIDVRSPDAKGIGTADLLSILVTSNMLNKNNLTEEKKL